MIHPGTIVKARIEALGFSIAETARRASINRVELSQLINQRRARLGYEASVALARVTSLPLRDLGFPPPDGVRW